jgi:hypothetical protein
MKTLPFPTDPKDPIECADWLELTAMVSAEKDAAFANLERNLKRLGVYAGRSPNASTLEEDARIESACSEVKAELFRRSLAAGVAYPFEVATGRIIFVGLKSESAAYVFCLCLSWFGWQPRKGGKVFPRRLFEDLSKHAAAAFVHGNALRFGAPRTELPSNFKQALLRLSLEIREGKVKNLVGPLTAQDDTLDLIAWRDHPDFSEGKLMLVGQCASGKDWESKKRELDVEAFFDDWFEDKPPTLLKSMILAFFVPHRIPRAKWVRVTKRAGILFDRCRIAYWSHLDQKFTQRTPYIEWVSTTIDKVQIRL